MKSWADIGFEIEMTRDNSPTLRLLHSVDPERDRGESMHHSAGACGETLLIYGNPAGRTFEQISKPSFMVVGLGLGYIEMTIAKEALLLGKSPQDIEKLTSYESIPELREFFYLWLWDHRDQLLPDVREIYDEAVACVVQNSAITSEQVKEFLRFHFPVLGKLDGALEKVEQVQDRYHCILFDAYSAKTTPHLWDEEFLQLFFARACAGGCFVSTYSGKAEFKEALRKNNFSVVAREAFHGKRKSTIAHRVLEL